MCGVASRVSSAAGSLTKDQVVKNRKYFIGSSARAREKRGMASRARALLLLVNRHAGVVGRDGRRRCPGSEDSISGTDDAAFSRIMAHLRALCEAAPGGPLPAGSRVAIVWPGVDGYPFDWISPLKAAERIEELSKRAKAAGTAPSTAPAAQRPVQPEAAVSDLLQEVSDELLLELGGMDVCMLTVTDSRHCSWRSRGGAEAQAPLGAFLDGVSSRRKVLQFLIHVGPAPPAPTPPLPTPSIEGDAPAADAKDGAMSPASRQHLRDSAEARAEAWEQSLDAPILYAGDSTPASSLISLLSVWDFSLRLRSGLCALRAFLIDATAPASTVPSPPKYLRVVAEAPLTTLLPYRFDSRRYRVESQGSDEPLAAALRSARPGMALLLAAEGAGSAYAAYFDSKSNAAVLHCLRRAGDPVYSLIVNAMAACASSGEAAPTVADESRGGAVADDAFDALPDVDFRAFWDSGRRDKTSSSGGGDAAPDKRSSKSLSESADAACGRLRALYTEWCADQDATLVSAGVPDSHPAEQSKVHTLLSRTRTTAGRKRPRSASFSDATSYVPVPPTPGVLVRAFRNRKPRASTATGAPVQALRVRGLQSGLLDWNEPYQGAKGAIVWARRGRGSKRFGYLPRCASESRGILSSRGRAKRDAATQPPRGALQPVPAGQRLRRKAFSEAARHNKQASRTKSRDQRRRAHDGHTKLRSAVNAELKLRMSKMDPKFKRTFRKLVEIMGIMYKSKLQKGLKGKALSKLVSANFDAYYKDAM